MGHSHVTQEDGIYSCPHPAIKRRLDEFWKDHKELAMANSHANARIPTGDGTSYDKWCVLCGKPFNTVNETRQTCDACQKKIFRKDDLEKARRKSDEIRKKREARRKAEEKRKKREALLKAGKKQVEKSSAK